jgi:hypothetical protein
MGVVGEDPRAEVRERTRTRWNWYANVSGEVGWAWELKWLSLTIVGRHQGQRE